MRTPEYSVVIRGFTDAANDDFSPGAPVLFIDNPTNLAWTEYVNEVGESFVTLSKKDRKTADFFTIASTVIGHRYHYEVWRDGEQVWGGWIGETDETETDVIIYAYSYLSGFFDLLTEYDRKWTAQNVSTIVQDALNLAQTKTESRVHWITDGLIQNPWTDDTQTVGITMALYRAPYKRILSVFKEMAAYSISDTTNHVIFEVTPSGQFNFRRDRKSTISNVRSSVFGNVRSYRRILRPVHRRNVIYAVGTSPTDVNLNTTVTHTALKQAMGRSEEPIYLSFVRDATELSRVASLRRARATRVDNDLFVSFNRNSVVPYRATGQAWQIGDLIDIGIPTNTGGVGTEQKVVAGQQVVFHRKMENVRILLADRL